MVSTLQHFIWGFVAYSAISDSFNLKALAIFLFLTQLPDFDFPVFFFYKNSSDHRTWFHNIFSLLILSLIGGLFLPQPIPFIAIGLHLCLDLFDGRGIPLLFPLSHKRSLIYKIGHEFDAPLKIFWEGSPTLFLVSMFAFVFAFINLFV